MQRSPLGGGGVLSERKPRRWWRWLLAIAGALLLLLALAIGGGWLYLTSDAGAELVRARALAVVNDALAGKVEAKHLTLEGGVLVLEDVKLYTPEGELVAEAKRITVDAALWALTRQQVVVRHAKVEGLRLLLKSDERGLNLTRAVEAKVANQPSTQGGSAFIEVQAVELAGGTVDFVDGEQHLALSELSLSGKATVHTGPLSVDGALQLHAKLAAPFEDTLEVEVGARTPKAGEVQLAVSAKTSDTRVKATLGLADLTANIEELVASPRLVRAFAPGFKLRVPVSVKGKASSGAVNVAVEAGAARATVKGNFREGGVVDGVDLDLTGLDLAELIEGGRKSSLGAKLHGRLSDARLGTLEGALKGDATWSDDGKVLATVTVDATAVKGTVTFEQLRAKVPGAELSVKGSGTQYEAQLAGRLEATDLAAVARTLADFTGEPPPPLSGAGSLAVTAHGPLLHPAVAVKGSFPQLSFDTLKLSGLSIDASVPDVQRPFETDGTVSVERLVSGDTVLEHLSAELSTRGRELHVRLSTQQLAKLALSVVIDGTLDAGNQGLQLSAMVIEYPEARWQLEQPAHLGWGGGVFAVEQLSLRAGDQQLTLSGRKQGRRTEGAVGLTAIDLEKLPRALVPASLALSGRLDGKVHATGVLPKLEADAELAWRDGRVQGVTGISLTLKGHATEERATGSLALKSAVGDAEGTFEVPLAARGSGKPEPLAVKLTTGALDLSKVAAALGITLPAEGAVTLTLEVGGTLDAPLPTLHAESPNLKTPRLTFDRVQVDLKTGDDGKLVGSVAATALGGLATAQLKLPLALGEVLDAYLPPKPKRGPAQQAKGVDWTRTPLEVAVTADGIDLATLEAAGLVDTTLAGKLQLRASARGTVEHPDVDAQLSVAHLVTEQAQPLDGSLTLKTTRHDAQLNVELKHATTTVLVASANLGAPLETVRDEDELTRTGLVVDADVGPLDLSQLLKAPDPEDPVPGGTLRAHLGMRGSAAAPKGTLRGTLEQLHVGKATLGQANLAWDYEAGKHVLASALTSTGGGTLKAHAELTLDVSVPAVRRGLELSKAPFTASLLAERFDLGFLSGVHPSVRTVGGQLTLDAKLEGTVGSPGFKGAVEWTQGRIALAGVGEYKDVHLALTGNNDGYQLTDLTAHAGAGSVKLAAGAKRVKPGVFALDAKGQLKDFPIITDDQLFALATMQFDLVGEASPTLIDLQRLSIPEAHLELPQVKRKDLQDLQRSGDIVLVRNGVPVLRKKKKPVAGEAAQQPGLMIRVQLDAPRNLWVKSSDVNLELGLSENFRVEVSDRTLIYGEANVLRGRLDVIGRRFDIQKDSQVRFAGLAAQPYLNVTAVHVNEREAVTVFVTVTGRGTDFTLKTSSQPPLSDSEIFTLLTTGRRTLKRGGGSSISGADAASVLGSLAASQLKTFVAKKLPLDVLSIESGTEGIQTAKVEAGTYLSDQVYVGYQLQLGADRAKGENLNAAKVEYQISRRWSLEATAGDAPAAGAELVWSREY